MSAAQVQSGLARLIKSIATDVSTQAVVLVDSSGPCPESIGEFVAIAASSLAEADLIIRNVIDNFVTMNQGSRMIVCIASVVDFILSVGQRAQGCELVAVYSSNSDYPLVKILSGPSYPWAQVIDIRDRADMHGHRSGSVGSWGEQTEEVLYPSTPPQPLAAPASYWQQPTSSALGDTAWLGQTSRPPSLSSGLLTSRPAMSNATSGSSVEMEPSSLFNSQWNQPMFLENNLLLDSENKLDLWSYTIAVYFDKLIAWSAENDDNASKVSGSSGGSGCGYLLGENTADYDHAIDQRCALAVNIDTAMNTYSLVIKGRSAFMVNKRSQRLVSMIEETKKSRELFQLPDWTNNHRNAISGSEIIKQQEKNASASAYFTSNSGLTVVEIVACSAPQVAALWTFLKILRPQEMTMRLIKFPHGLVNQLHRSYACLVEMSDHDQMVICGFGPTLLNQALAHLPGSDNASFSSGSTDQRSASMSSLTASQGYYAQPYRGTPVMTPGMGPTSRPYQEYESQIRKVHRGAYSFADREAGIFFFAFEMQFRDYLEKAYQVIVEDSDFSAQYKQNMGMGMGGAGGVGGMAGYGNRQGAVDMDATFDLNKNIVLKISFYGNSMKNVSAARGYLEQLNTSSLARIQLFFPAVSAKKYKEVFTRKATQCTYLTSIRQNAGEDPLTTKGFVNIRIKPPMHAHGTRRIGLPADTTVTICGSILAEANIQLMQELEAQFNDIPSDYIVSEIKIPYAHPMKRNLTIKSLREELICKYNLIALKWEEGSRSTGSVGTAKIWAASRESMSALLMEIKAAEVELERAGIYTNYSQTSADSVLALNNALYEGNQANASNTINSTLMALTEQARAPEKDGKEVKSVVYLTDLTLRYVLLAPPLNKQLADLLEIYSRQGVKIKYPYRDRNDAHAALLLEGDQAAVGVANTVINQLIRDAARNILSIYMIITEEQHKVISSADLAGVKYIQGQAGVHLRLDAVPHEVSKATAVFDMRLFHKSDEALTVALKGERSLELTIQCAHSKVEGVHGLMHFVPSDSAKPVEAALINGKQTIRVALAEDQGIMSARLTKALELASDLHLSSLAVLVPEDASLVTLCIDSAMNLGAQAPGLHRVVLVECTPAEITAQLEGKSAEADTSTEENTAKFNLDPAENTPLVKRMLYHLEAQMQASAARYTASGAPSPMVALPGSTPVIKLLICNTPLPFSLTNHLVASSNAYQPQKHKSVLLRGLPGGISIAIDLLNGLFQQPAAPVAPKPAPAPVQTMPPGMGQGRPATAAFEMGSADTPAFSMQGMGQAGPDMTQGLGQGMGYGQSRQQSLGMRPAGGQSGEYGMSYGGGMGQDYPLSQGMGQGMDSMGQGADYYQELGYQGYGQQSRSLGQHQGYGQGNAGYGYQRRGMDQGPPSQYGMQQQSRGMGSGQPFGMSYGMQESGYLRQQQGGGGGGGGYHRAGGGYHGQQQQLQQQQYHQGRGMGQGQHMDQYMGRY